PLLPLVLAARRVGVAALALSAAGCAASPGRFPLRDPMLVDADLQWVSVPCHRESSAGDPNHMACAPAVYESPFAWYGIDNSIFRPLAGAFAIDPGGEATNVNSLDEVPDSAWFTNR